MVAKENRYIEYGKEGDMNELMSFITSQVKMEYNDIVKNLPSWLSMLTERQCMVIRLHYFFKEPINVIRFRLGLVSNRDVERSLDAGKNKLIKIIKQFEEA